ncbi:hypothetical protein PVK06_029651 [Gossypium arboreum]|uniref:Uncharacterized protein n=1 Tax=Gossypium arboreum TaxID=29729 RepID=A0ABR0NL51_GOSAR|nr:hypothetical protein PVK06_029651 [Gossypium arboreum]
MVGTVAKLDFNTYNGVRGRFARMTVYVNLGKALTSKVLINGIPQRIEYEHLPTTQTKTFGPSSSPKRNQTGYNSGKQEQSGIMHPVPGIKIQTEPENRVLEETQSAIQQTGGESGIEATEDKANNTKNER